MKLCFRQGLDFQRSCLELNMDSTLPYEIFFLHATPMALPSPKCSIYWDPSMYILQILKYNMLRSETLHLRSSENCSEITAVIGLKSSRKLEALRSFEHLTRISPSRVLWLMLDFFQFFISHEWKEKCLETKPDRFHFQQLVYIFFFFFHSWGVL